MSSSSSGEHTPEPETFGSGDPSASDSAEHPPTDPTGDAPETPETPETEAAPPPASFDDFELPAWLRQALTKMGWAEPTAVQTMAFDLVREGRDVLVQSQTGSGKTGAFCLPWLAARFTPGAAKDTGVQLLVLTPTRELAKQVCEQLDSLAAESGLVSLPIYGGTAMQPQLQSLRDGVHAVVGTPGRILDHIRRRSLDLSRVGTVVLDEADEMLSMGFLEDIHSILEACQTDRQTTLFSATVPPDIERIARRYMRNPEPVRLSGDQVAAAEIDHTYYGVAGAMRVRDLVDVINLEEPTTGIVFCNTREETNMVASVLQREGFAAEALSSDLTQKARERVMGWMRSGTLRFLVATDVASRGIDISHVSHVINYTFPENAESYIHRTGRTGRAGRPGVAISLIAPQELGSFYMLKKMYPSLRFAERKLPNPAELEAQRIETKLDMVSKLFPELVSPEWTLLARNLMKDPRGERVIAYLLSEGMSERRKPTVVRHREDEEEPERIERGRRSRERGPREREHEHGLRDREHGRDRERGRDDRERGRDDRERRPRRRRDEGRRHENGRDEGVALAAEDRRPSEDVEALEPTVREAVELDELQVVGPTDELEVDEGQSREGGRRRRRRRRRGRGDASGESAAAEPAADEAFTEVVASTDDTPLAFSGAPDTDSTLDAGAETAADAEEHEGVVTVDPEQPTGLAATDDGARLDEQTGRRRRRRRRRRGGSNGVTPGDERDVLEASDDQPETETEEAEGDAGESEDGARRRRRRRRGGRRRTPPRTEVAAPQAPHVSQDQIIIDIDESELEVVRDEFGEIDELDDLTLKGRRRGVIDDLQDEVELEDLRDEQRAAAEEPEPSADDDDDDDDDDDESAEQAAQSADDAKKKKRRRRRRKKKEEAPPPELTAPPHKDFWEVWAAKFTYREFEDEIWYQSHAAPPPDEPEPPVRAESVVRESLAAANEDDASFVSLRLNIGRKHGKKAAHIRELLDSQLGLSGKAVRNLTVGDASTRFRVSERNVERVQQTLGGYQLDEHELAISLVETPAEASEPAETSPVAASSPEVQVAESPSEEVAATAEEPTDEARPSDGGEPSETVFG